MNRVLARSDRPTLSLEPGVGPQAGLPYGLHLIEEDDVAAVVAALCSDLLAQGPRVAAFERAFAERVQAPHAVAVSSGTAALHLALAVADVGEGDVCVVPAVTFLSTATAALHCGAEAVFADVDPQTGLATAETVSAAAAGAGRRVSAVLPVHLSGRLCDTAAIAEAARGLGAVVIEDACHAVGGADAEGAPVGACPHSQATVFSFHPVKTIAAGEGGMVALRDAAQAERLRRLRNHGVTRDSALMGEAGSFAGDGQANPWSYEQLELGFNYRMNEMEAALGLSQLGKLDRFIARRAALAARYDRLLGGLAPVVRPVSTPAGQRPTLHLYTVLIDFEAVGLGRAEVMRALAERGVGTQVHYIPLYRQPFFKSRYGEMRLPGAEAYYARCLALPLFPAMSDAHVDQVVLALTEVLGGF
ncbi:MAG TPA: UDP-4-amino-4,6-dideoxy-N-acetyl-beta-L-altrosamine transaminase [Caulobacteraceae bacterium]|jgi:UDP-4-amino-4,6-dideoxy-N-acetyl-beta-L-altrosamine transaminase|nr:UDP-4-amino-4,6-dideoxy-N-acetyl-beta-L-altrosamine transaminase [Caulobacteraceae bacterium]